MIQRHVAHRSMLFWSLFLLLLNLSYTFTIPTTTLREYLISDSEGDGEGIYLAMGPAFFGFFGYFGALAGIEDEIYRVIDMDGNADGAEFSPATSLLIEHDILRGVSGASAGAMAAVALAAGISPHRGGEFVSRIKLADFADPGGFGGIMKGNRFETLMVEFLQTLSPITTKRDINGTWASLSGFPLQMEDALIPVAVSAVDMKPRISSPDLSFLEALQSPLKFIASTFFPKAKILLQGSMARAARASACFPGLFQPVGWVDRSSWSTSSLLSNNTSSGSHDTSSESSFNGANDYSLLIDGGIFDWAGYNGLKDIISATGDNKKAAPQKNQIRVLNLVIGSFLNGPPGPEAVSKSLGVDVDSVLSLSINGLPKCGPLAMHKGPFASRAARLAIRAAMGRPIIATTSTVKIDGTTQDDDEQKRQHHFVLDIDASPFVDMN